MSRFRTGWPTFHISDEFFHLQRKLSSMKLLPRSVNLIHLILILLSPCCLTSCIQPVPPSSENSSQALPGHKMIILLLITQLLLLSQHILCKYKLLPELEDTSIFFYLPCTRFPLLLVLLSRFLPSNHCIWFFHYICFYLVIPTILLIHDLLHTILRCFFYVYSVFFTNLGEIKTANFTTRNGDTLLSEPYFHEHLFTVLRAFAETYVP